MNCKRTRLSLLALVCQLVVGACASPMADVDAGPGDAGRLRDAPPVDAWIPPVPETVPTTVANALMPSDPLFEGQQRFLYDAFGTERFAEWPPADFMLALMTDEPAVFGNQYESFGFVRNPDDDFPFGFTRGLDDPTLVHAACALCHTARLPDGRIWLGAPNGALEIGRFQVEVSARWVAAGHPPLLDATDATKALAWGPGRFGADIGRSPQVVPVDFPPYFLLGQRDVMNYLGTSLDARSEMYLSLFGLGAGAPNEAEALVHFPGPARFDPLLEYMLALGSPPPPPGGDATLIALGETVYARERCGSCHHVDDASMEGVTPYDRAADGRDRVPGDDPAFPDGSIHTDYWHRTLIDGVPDAGTGPTDFSDYIAFITEHRLAVGTSDGYRVQNLHGLWATAPYLHNGSVPTLDDLLRPAAARPATFMRETFLVDTTTTANSNAGHEFGTTINDTDRAALVAYLLSL